MQLLHRIVLYVEQSMSNIKILNDTHMPNINLEKYNNYTYQFYVKPLLQPQPPYRKILF